MTKHDRDDWILLILGIVLAGACAMAVLYFAGFLTKLGLTW